MKWSRPVVMASDRCSGSWPFLPKNGDESDARGIHGIGPSGDRLWLNKQERDGQQRKVRNQKKKREGNE